jgi:viroplasmin and RNaseH domain-containing protein
LLKIFFDSLGELSSKRLEELAEGKLVIKFEYLQDEVKKKTPPKAQSKAESVPDEVCEKVNSFTSREAAREYLENLNYKKSQLIEIARYFKIFLVSNDTKALIISKIIEGVVGSKLRFAALLDCESSAEEAINPKPSKAESVPDEVCEKVQTFNSREEAREYLENLNYKKSQLIEIARYFKIALLSKDTKTLIIDKIVEIVVGSRLRFDALLNWEEIPQSSAENAPDEICETLQQVSELPEPPPNSEEGSPPILKIGSVPDEIYEKLINFSTHEAAREYLESFNFKKPQLMQIAQHYKIFFISKNTKECLISKIIEVSVGYCQEAESDYEKDSQPADEIESVSEQCENSVAVPSSRWFGSVWKTLTASKTN